MTDQSIECVEKKDPVVLHNQIPLKSHILWAHSVDSSSWSIESYDKIYEINNVGRFWYIFNNLPLCDIKNNHFYLMKDGVDPIWEHVENRNGGVCSFRILLKDSMKLFEYLCILMLCDQIYEGGNMDDITGVSISPKNSWAIVKIWNKDSKHDVVNLLNKDIKSKYSSISIQYKANTPEY